MAGEERPDPVLSENRRTGLKAWLKRLGVAGILFFTIKGIITTTLIVLACFGVRGCG